MDSSEGAKPPSNTKGRRPKGAASAALSELVVILATYMNDVVVHGPVVAASVARQRLAAYARYRMAMDATSVPPAPGAPGEKG